MTDTKPGIGIHPLRELWLKYGNVSDLTVFVWDGFNSNQRRRDLYPDYKGNRPERSEDTYAIFKLFQELLTHTPCMQIKVPDWEADDVIYTLAKFFSKQHDEVTIISNDADYLQMADFPGVKLPAVTKWMWPNDLIVAYKATVGDDSDNIPGIPRYGEGMWKNSSTYHYMMKEALETKNWDLWNTIAFPKLAQKACLNKDNFDKACLYYQVVTLLDVPLDDITVHSHTGQCDPRAAEALLMKFML